MEYGVEKIMGTFGSNIYLAAKYHSFFIPSRKFAQKANISFVYMLKVWSMDLRMKLIKLYQQDEDFWVKINDQEYYSITKNVFM